MTIEGLSAMLQRCVFSSQVLEYESSLVGIEDIIKLKSDVFISFVSVYTVYLEIHGSSDQQRIVPMKICQRG